MGVSIQGGPCIWWYFGDVCRGSRHRSPLTQGRRTASDEHRTSAIQLRVHKHRPVTFSLFVHAFSDTQRPDNYTCIWSLAAKSIIRCHRILSSFITDRRPLTYADNTFCGTWNLPHSLFDNILCPYALISVINQIKL